MPAKKSHNAKNYADDLFSVGQKPTAPKTPLADRMRPRTFAQFVGQGHIVGDQRLLRRAIEADQLVSVLLWGPPGSGKTTLANIIAQETSAHFATLNAVLAGVKELRDVIEQAENLPQNQRTVLFVDEIHRWNKAQQEALLPHIEAGTVILVGATAENPFFSLVNPLLSRSRVFRLQALTEADLVLILQRAIADHEHGYGGLSLQVEEAALLHWAKIAQGDARSALNALELAALTTPPDAAGQIHISLAVAAESIQARVLSYDRAADEHYDTISAFIKSLRGSDADAALYWMAKMLTAGEEPRFLFRRMLILCSEDIGLADPQAIVVINALADAFERAGMPEGNYFLAQACLYCATAPKSNSTGAIFAALDHIEKQGAGPVPPHLRDSTSNAAQARHEGEVSPSLAYQNPHHTPNGWLDQLYLPEGMARPYWYKPKSIGHEASIIDRLRPRGHLT
jgi:putative ATPase